MTKKRLFIVDTISTFRMRYVIEAESLSHAYDEVTMEGSENNPLNEVSQKHLGETIVDGREITAKQFRALITELAHDEDESCNDWMGDQLIHKIDYEDI